jgi:hypothetical protein
MLQTGTPEPLYLTNTSSDGDVVLPNLTNVSSFYPITLTATTLDWLGSGTPLTIWHDEASLSSGDFDKYL